jgi:hypothetical protein
VVSLFFAACGDTGHSVGPGPDGGSAADLATAEVGADVGLGDQGQPFEQGAQPDAIPAGTIDYLLLAPGFLSTSAKRHQAYRDKTGHGVAVVLVDNLAPAGADAPTVAAAIKATVKKYYDLRDPTRPFYVLLLGDGTMPIPPGTYTDPSSGPIATDNTYADMDGDDLPDLLVGRISAHSDKEAGVILDKIESYEKSYETGLWNRRLNMFASTGGFGPLVDPIIENVALEVVNSISYDYDFTVTYGLQTSPYVYIPEFFSDKVYDRINEGALLVAYVGHGSESGVDSLTWNGQDYPILKPGQMSTKLKAQHRSPLLFLIACLTGSFADKDSLAELFLREKEGPPAVVASTEISHPYTNAILVRELAAVATDEHPATVGRLFQRAKERLVKQKDAVRDMIDFYALFLLKPGEKETLQRAHLHMYTLFGDPAMTIRYVGAPATPAPSPSTVKRGTEVTVVATVAGFTTGTAHVTLESSRKVILGQIEQVPSDTDLIARNTVIMANYDTANNKVAVEKDVSFSSGTASVTLAVPATLPAGGYYLKIYAQDSAGHDAFGSAALNVTQ